MISTSLRVWMAYRGSLVRFGPFRRVLVDLEKPKITSEKRNEIISWL
jgi:hypothetical protein